MTSKDVYLELAEMVNQNDAVGLPATPAMLKVLRLQFTPEEARLAVQVGLTGGTLGELSAKTGIEKAKLQEMLKTMAYKGTVWIDPEKEDPVYRVVGSTAPGLIETGIWGNIRFPYDVELGKALHEAIFDLAREKLSKLGFPYAPVFANPWALPEDALPSENLAETLRQQDFISVSFCPCRLSHWLADPGNHCQHLLETCIHYGDGGRWCVEHGQARRISADEAVELLRKCSLDGLVHSIDMNGFICNCCADCCVNFRAHLELGAKALIPSPFMPQIDRDECNACGFCADACPVGAMKVDDFAEPDSDLCIGCGVCVPRCDVQAIKLIRRVPA
ncbi:MAG: 4Fe-4S dicluster domain-containing protein [Chloroflexi bacterium]|nr:4Fe-4S dicluster domain-containing protein [Chloroflexota bacterium]